MAFNVSDANGRHLGFVHRRFIYIKNGYMAALTEKKLGDNIRLNAEKMKKSLATRWDCVGLFGKVKEESLKKRLTAYVSRNLPQFKDRALEEWVKILYLHFNYPLDEIFTVGEDAIKGYLLIQPDRCRIENHTLVTDEETRTNMIEDHTLRGEGPPLFVRVIDYPVMKTKNQGMVENLLTGGDPADLGGYNHIHITKLQILSGNMTETLRLPGHIQVKKGMVLQIYMKDGQMKKFFCDGTIYEI